MVEQRTENPWVSGSTPLLDIIQFYKFSVSLICDLLIRLKNASNSHLKTAIVPYSKITLSLLRVCLKEGLITSFYLNNTQKFLKVNLKYSSNGKATFSHIQLLSTPGKLLYIDYPGLCKITRGIHVLLISTDIGILTDIECIRLKKGGTVLCSIS